MVIRLVRWMVECRIGFERKAKPKKVYICSTTGKDGLVFRDLYIIYCYRYKIVIVLQNENFQVFRLILNLI